MTEAQLSNLNALASLLHRYPSAKIKPYMSQLEEAIAELMDATFKEPDQHRACLLALGMAKQRNGVAAGDGALAFDQLHQGLGERGRVEQGQDPSGVARQVQGVGTVVLRVEVLQQERHDGVTQSRHQLDAGHHECAVPEVIQGQILPERLQGLLLLGAETLGAVPGELGQIGKGHGLGQQPS